MSISSLERASSRSQGWAFSEVFSDSTLGLSLMKLARLIKLERGSNCCACASGLDGLGGLVNQGCRVSPRDTALSRSCIYSFISICPKSR